MKQMLYVEAVLNELEGGHTKFQFEQILAFWITHLCSLYLEANVLSKASLVWFYRDQKEKHEAMKMWHENCGKLIGIF